MSGEYAGLPSIPVRQRQPIGAPPRGGGRGQQGLRALLHTCWAWEQCWIKSTHKMSGGYAGFPFKKICEAETANQQTGR